MVSQRDIRHRKVQIRAAYLEGIPMNEICATFGVSEKYAYGILSSQEKKARLGLPETLDQKSSLEISTPDRESLAQSILALMLTSPVHLTATELAVKLGTDRKNVNSVLYDAKFSFFQKSSSDLPPHWTLKTSPIEKRHRPKTATLGNESDQNADSKNFESFRENRVCSLCGDTATELFCSDLCRKRSIDCWFKSQFQLVYFSNSTEFLKFHFRNLTREFEQTFIEVLGEVCNHSTSISSTMLDMFQTHAKNNNQIIECLTNAYNNWEIDEPLFRGPSLEVSIANISSKYRSQVQNGLKNLGLSSSTSECVSRNQFNKIPRLSTGARKYTETLFMRREVLLNDYDEQFVDDLSFRFLGISDELIGWIGVRGSVRSEDLERYCWDMNKSLPLQLQQEFYDLLVAIKVQSFLPTYRLIQNMELGIPEVLIEELSPIRSRLIQVLERNRTGETKREFDRLIRMLQVLEGVATGKSLDVLGSEMNLSRERVRQMILPIFSQVGVDGLLGLRLKAQRKRQDVDIQKVQQVSEIRSDLTMFIRAHPGVSVAELGEVFLDNDEEVLSAAKRHGALVLRIFPIPEDKELKIRSDIIQSLKDASLLAFPLTGISYDELLEQGLIIGVSRGRILQVFGTWIAACENAEVEPGTALKGVTYVRTYSYKEMLRVVGQFLIDDDLRGFKGGVHSYGDWRTSQELADILPSQGTIRNQVDTSWKRVKELAMVELRSTWTRMNGVGSEKHDE